jgi:hypothetical protein
MNGRRLGLTKAFSLLAFLKSKKEAPSIDQPSRYGQFHTILVPRPFQSRPSDVKRRENTPHILYSSCLPPRPFDPDAPLAIDTPPYKQLPETYKNPTTVSYLFTILLFHRALPLVYL